MTRARPFHILTQRLPTKYNGGANLLKGLKYSNNLLRNLGVDNLLVTWINLQNKNTCLISKSHLTTLSKQKFSKTKWKLFQKTYIFVYIPTWIITKVAITLASFQNIFKPTLKHHFKQLKTKGKWSKQVTKSPWVTMDRKGANTFPFYNLLPEPKKTSQRFLLCFLTFP